MLNKVFINIYISTLIIINEKYKKMSKILPEFRYSKEHEWIKRDEKKDQNVIIGITDHAQDALGDIVHIDLPPVGTEFDVQDEMGVIESAKSASEFYAPISGKVIEVNDCLDKHPEYINESPYDKGWILKIKLNDPDELDDLLSADGYENFLDEL